MPPGNLTHNAAYHSSVLLHDFALLSGECRRSVCRKSVLADGLFHATTDNVQVRRAMLNSSTLRTEVIAELNLSDLHYRVLWQLRLRELSAALRPAHQRRSRIIPCNAKAP
jgi:hypothetical protein